MMNDKNYCFKKYYFTAVFGFGVPMYLRDLTYDEAYSLYEAHIKNEDINYCQYGSSEGTVNAYCRGTTFS